MIKGFHREGKTILISSVTISVLIIGLMLFLETPSPWLLFVCLAIGVILYLFFQFFRIPRRDKITDEQRFISPCDGKVVVIEEVFEPEFLKEQCRQISIFMSPLNVHINWYPASGEVLYQKYHPGKYLVAWHPKSSTENERTTVVVGSENGRYLMRQIAGAVARRIVCYSKKDDSALQGEEMGFIKFGSRVDVFVPLSADIEVSIDDVVKGGITSLASW